MMSLSRRLLGQCLVAVVVAVGALLVAAPPAAAHASFMSASPAPGAGLPQAPAAVAIRFSEPLNPGLSRIRVLDRSGRDVGLGTTESVPRDARSMRRRVGGLRVGQYTVAWTSVSSLDGHSLHGSYTFAVGTAATTDAAPAAAGPVSSEGWAGLVGRWVALVGFALWIGTVVLRAPLERQAPGQNRLARAGRLGPTLVFVGMAAASLSLAAVATGSILRVDRVLSFGRAGHWRAAELAGAAAGAFGPRRRAVQAPMLVLTIVAETVSGHTSSSATPGLATVSLVVHIVAVGVWVYAIAAGVLARRSAAVLGVVWIYAAVAAGAVAATGVINALIEVNRFGELVSTSYGRTVLLKVVALVAMACLGLAHHLRRRRAPTSDGVIRRIAGVELIAGAVAIALATVLVGFPNPPRQAEASERAEGTTGVLADLVHRPALSIAAPSGPYIAGLTILPPRPGPIELRLVVLGVEAGDGLGHARVGLTGPDGTRSTSALVDCGLGCFTGHARVSAVGAWAFGIDIDSTRHPVHVTFAATLPTPDGAAMLAVTLTRLEQQLRSATMQEQLRGTESGVPIVANYAFSAPDALAIDVNGRSQIVIGARSYDRATPTSPWVESASPGSSFQWPRGYFRDFWHDPAAARIVGHDNIDGMEMTIVSFVRTDLPAWFRVWIGPDGFVHREEMRAEGHLMDHAYGQLNSTAPVVAPTSSTSVSSGQPSSPGGLHPPSHRF